MTEDNVYLYKDTPDEKLNETNDSGIGYFCEFFCW